MLQTCVSIGVSFSTYAASNEGYLSSGPFDNRIRKPRQGIYFSKESGTAARTTPEAPSNASVGYETRSTTGASAQANSSARPAQYNQNLNTERMNDEGYGTEYTQETRDQFITKGYNSNYTQSWYMAYTQWKDNRIGRTGQPADMSRGVFGLLKEHSMQTVSSSIVPLMADARVDADSGDTNDVVDFADEKRARL